MIEENYLLRHLIGTFISVFTKSKHHKLIKVLFEELIKSPTTLHGTMN